MNLHSLTFGVDNTQAVIVGKLKHLSGDKTMVRIGEKLEYTLTAEEGFELPDTVEVTMGGTILGDGAYTYSKETGTIVIEAGNRQYLHFRQELLLRTCTAGQRMGKDGNPSLACVLRLRREERRRAPRLALRQRKMIRRPAQCAVISSRPRPATFITPRRWFRLWKRPASTRVTGRITPARMQQAVCR